MIIALQLSIPFYTQYFTVLGVGVSENLYHPADTNKNHSFSIGEVIGYASEWKQGNLWNGEAIEIGYVIRAASIWKQGETYEYISSTNAPMCWEFKQ